MPGGIAVFDYDGDGRPDIYFTNGAEIPSLEKSSPRYWNRLYRNEGGMKFRDVTEEAGVAGAGYSMGAAAADYDNDGHTDLFVAGVNRNILYRNLGNGRFEDVTAKRRYHERRMGGRRGLVRLRPRRPPRSLGRALRQVVDQLRPVLRRRLARDLRIYCHPKYFEGLASTLYRNRGDGTFEDVTAAAGLAKYRGPRHVASRSPTTTRTVGRTPSSPTTTCPTSCSTTRGTARLRRLR